MRVACLTAAVGLVVATSASRPAAQNLWPTADLRVSSPDLIVVYTGWNIRPDGSVLPVKDAIDRIVEAVVTK